MVSEVTHDEHGASMTEYVIATALVAIVSIGAVFFLDLAARERAGQSQGVVETAAPCRNLKTEDYPYGCM